MKERFAVALAAVFMLTGVSACAPAGCDDAQSTVHADDCEEDD